MVYIALFPSTRVFFRLCKYDRGSAAGNRKPKHLCPRGKTKSKGQPAIPTPDCELPVWHMETHPLGSTLTGWPSSWLLMTQQIGTSRCMHGKGGLYLHPSASSIQLAPEGHRTVPSQSSIFEDIKDQSIILSSSLPS